MEPGAGRGREGEPDRFRCHSVRLTTTARHSHAVENCRKSLGDGCLAAIDRSAVGGPPAVLGHWSWEPSDAEWGAEAEPRARTGGEWNSVVVLTTARLRSDDRLRAPLCDNQQEMPIGMRIAVRTPIDTRPQCRRIRRGGDIHLCEWPVPASLEPLS